MSHSPARNISLSNLAYDTLIQIVVLTAPQDVLSLRMCCKTLYSVTRDRHVWIQLLRHSCFVYRLFSPTFPLKKMTVSELEHAVTSPFRFSTLLRRAAGSLDACNRHLPCLTRTLSYRPPGISDTLPDISTIYLVPGGRFLLTSSTDFVMSLWDLGYNARAFIEPSPVASMVFKHAVSEFEVQATADGLGIRICIVARSPLSTLFKFIEIYPSSPSVSFSQITSFSLPHPILSYSFNNDLVAYHYDDDSLGGNRIGVRNFVSNTTIAWSVYSVDFESRITSSDVFVIEDTILFLQDSYSHKEFLLWHIPPLRPVLDMPNVLRFNREIFQLHSPNQQCCVSSQPAWFRSYPDYTQHIDLLGIANNGEHGVTRYVLKHINRCGDLSLPPFIPTLSLHFLPHDSYPEPDWIRDFNSTRLWDNSALLLWVEDQTLVANLSEMCPKSPASPGHSGLVHSPTSQDDHNEDNDWPWGAGKFTSTILYDTIEQPRKGAIAHCPMSGRLCVLSSNEIRVVDYLVPSV